MDSPTGSTSHLGVAPRHEDSAAPEPGDKAGRSQRLLNRRPSLWLLLAVLLGINWLFALNVQPSKPRTTVPYSYFRTQAQVGNVAEISSQGGTIQGQFRRAVRFSAGKARAPSRAFRPSVRHSRTISFSGCCSARTSSSTPSPPMTASRRSSQCSWGLSRPC